MNGSGEVSAGGVAFLVSQLGGLATLRFGERVGALGLTPAHTGLLRAIAAEPGRSQQAVSTQLAMLPSRLVALVDELEHTGLVERRRNPRDRRHHALHLTAAGQKALAEIGRVAQEHGEDFLAPLDEQERVVLAGLLRRLAEHHGLAPGVHPGYRTMGRSGAPPTVARPERTTDRPQAG